MLRQKLRNTLGIIGLVLGVGGWMECRSSSPPAVSAEVQVDEQQEYRNALLRRLVWSVANTGRLTNLSPELSEEERHRLERTALIQEIGEVLADRDAEIDALADEIYQRQGCNSVKRIYRREGGKDVLKEEKRPLVKKEMLGNIAFDARSFNELTGDYEASRNFGHQSTPRLRDELERLAGPLEYEDYRKNGLTTNLAYTLADARWNERCLNTGEGLVDMYIDAGRESEAGNCEQATNLFRNIGDAFESLREERYCTPSEYKDLSFDTQQELNAERFYEEILPTLSDKDLVESANVVDLVEEQRWQEECISVRNNRGYSQKQAAASCFADWIIQATMYTTNQFNVYEQPEPERLREWATYLPSKQVERRCALMVTAKNLDDINEARKRWGSKEDFEELPPYDPQEAYEKCVGS